MEQDIENLIKTFKKEDFFKTVDLHIHSTFSDGITPPEELVAQAKQKGFSYIAICDHNTVGAYINNDFSKESMLIPAIEFDCWFKGVLIHILGYGIDVNNEALKRFYAKNKRGTEADIVRLFSYRNPAEVIKAIHNAGGIASLAHPACYWCVSLDHFVKSLIKLGLDALECYYPYLRHRGIIKFHKASTVEKIADKYGLIKTGGSDNHKSIL